MVSSTAGRGLVELHWGAFAGEWLRQTAAVDSAALLCRTQPVQVAGCEAWVLAPEDALIQAAVHLAINHQMAYPGLRGLLDVALLVRSPEFDWAAVAERAGEWRVATATWLVLERTAVLLGLPGSEDARRVLAPSPIRQGWLDRFVSVQHMLEGRDMTGGPRRLVFQLLLVDRPRDAIKLVARSLWPERAWLAARYGAASPLVRARHLVNAARGRL